MTPPVISTEGFSDHDTAPNAMSAGIGFSTAHVASAGSGACMGDWAKAFRTIDKWRMDPEVLRDDDSEPPSREILSRTLDLLGWLIANRSPAPTWVVPDRDGGLCLRFDRGAERNELEIDDRFNGEMLSWVGTRIIARRPINLEALLRIRPRD